MKYIFDVDGTLTPGKDPMSKSFREWFIEFQCNHLVYLVTGSDKKTLLYRVGSEVYDKAQRVYCESGNEVYEAGKLIHKYHWEVPDLVRSYLVSELRQSKYPLRTGRHIHVRPGRVYFSTVGKNTTMEQRDEYRKWDSINNERVGIADRFNKKFTDLHAAVHWKGIELNIFSPNKDKSQILRDFDCNVKFFANNMEKGGSDHTLYKAVRKRGGATYKVYDDRHTWELLKYETSVC